MTVSAVLVYRLTQTLFPLINQSCVFLKTMLLRLPLTVI